MENIKVISVLSKTTKTQKPYKTCEVECGGETRKVNIWSNAPDFANIKEGSILVGKMTKEGDYWNISFEGDKPRGGQNYANKEASVTKAMDRKEKSIGRFQDDKEFSIMVSSTMRDAVSLAIAEIKDITTLNTLERDILKWREWLIANWNVDEKDVPPFN
jgi:hypothetical protein